MISAFQIIMLAFAFSPICESKFRTPQLPSARMQFSTMQQQESIVHPQQQQMMSESPLSVLAYNFDQVLIAMNQNKDDIHVGHLLSACETLESTIRELGFASSANDMANNIAKIRNTYEKLPVTKRDSMPVLLKYEQDVGINAPNDKIKDSSATMGLLWLGRSVNCQYDMFQYILENPEASPYDAASHAYSHAVKPHLSWPLQRLGLAALSGIRSMKKQTILARMGGFNEDQYTSNNDSETKEGMRRVLATWNPIIRRWNQVLEDMGIEKL